MPAPEADTGVVINEHLGEYLRVAVVEDAKPFADPIFQRRYRQAAPDFPHHVVAFCRTTDDQWLPAAYIHFTDCGDHLLGGGACVDDRILRRLSPAGRKAIAAAGGLYFNALLWSVRHFSPDYPAIFGYCGDRLAERIDLAAGFVHTPHRHLLVYFTRPMAEQEKQRLIETARQVGPF